MVSCQLASLGALCHQIYDLATLHYNQRREGTSSSIKAILCKRMECSVSDHGIADLVSCATSCDSDSSAQGANMLASLWKPFE